MFDRSVSQEFQKIYLFYGTSKYCSNSVMRLAEKMQAVRLRGAVVEAAAEVTLGSPTASILIEPDGTVRIIATMEQIFSPAYCCVGHTFPQTSVVHLALADAAAAIGKHLFAVRCIGVALCQQLACRQ
jgi:hypothetical protein